MTMTSPEIPAEATKIVVWDRGVPLEFVGEKLVDLSWSYDDAAEADHTRWTDLILYRVYDESSAYRYVIQVVGRSVVYHKANGPCRYGVVMHVSRIRRDTERYDALVPCNQCGVGDIDEMDGTDSVAVEVDRPSLEKCRGAFDVVQVLQRRSARERESGLSMKMLQTAVEVDDDIASALVPRKL